MQDVPCWRSGALEVELAGEPVQSGYDAVYGARPLKRAIQKQVETKLGRLIIEGKVHDGDELVVDYDPKANQLRFE